MARDQPAARERRRAGQHERNVLLRNNGHGGFDEVSGTSGLDVDQDGRAFARARLRRGWRCGRRPDGAAIVAATPAVPQRLRGRQRRHRAPPDGHEEQSRRGRRARDGRDRSGPRSRAIVKAGSGFLSQHSKELLFGLGTSQRIVKVTIVWPSGSVQTVSGSSAQPSGLDRGRPRRVRTEPFRTASVATTTARPTRRRTTPVSPIDTGIWLYQPFPAPDFTLRGLDGQEYSLSALAGRPVADLFWATWAPPSRAALA